jgi:hypothetical protein
MIGKLERIPLREVWKHEAMDFTRWLEENIDVLSEGLDLNLSSAEREQNAGDFSVDLVAEDEGGDPVVIECQLERSDHDHLGKLVTYLSAIGAKTAIWIVADPRPEHVGAISWLNESSTAAFYLVKVEGVKIGTSEPAPLLTKIVGPSDEIRDAGRRKEELVERDIMFRKFWGQLLGKANPRTKLHASISPGRDYWIGASAGMSGLVLNYVIRRDECGVELYIDRGKGAEEQNKAIFDSLAASREQIEADFGAPLIWQRLEGRRACRIARWLQLGGYRDDEKKWSQMQDAMIDAMIRLEKALRPHIDRLKE